MAEGGIVKIVKELEEEVIDFVEEEVHEFEDSDGKKSKYSEKFQGDVLGKHDPYGEDAGDHEAHASESAIPDPDHGSEWFPAVPGIKAGKAAARQAAAKADSIGEADPKKQVSASGTPATQDAVQRTSLTSDVAPTEMAEDPKAKVKGGAEQRSSEGGNNDSPSSGVADATAVRGLAKAEAKHEAKAKETRARPRSSGDDPSLSIEDDKSARSVREPTDVPMVSKPAESTEADPAIVSQDQNREDEASVARASSGEDPSVEDFPAAADSGGVSPDSPQAIEKETFRKKAPILVADLREISKKGKKAKEKKEILRGVRRTLEKPHKLYKDPKRLIAARSGDPQRLQLSLKRHGRSVEPVDDSDPQDISATPAKLEAVRSNHRLAMRHMIDMGQQYGKDPFDGIDPVDVQAVIEHHASEHPHRKHKVPYHPHKRLDDESEPSDASEGMANEDATDENSMDARNEDGEDTGETSEGYPRLTEAQDLDVDNDSGGIRRVKSKKKKRKYPKPYRNDDNPTDLQLAADSLSAMAADIDDSELSEDAPIHKRRAHAAQKMLKCINRVRSFQQDPVACEGAFVDEAAEEGAEVAGLSPDEIEDRYYTLKQVAVHYEKRKKKKHRKDKEKFEGDGSDGRYDDSDPEETDTSFHKKKKHHYKKHQARYDDRGEDDFQEEDYDSESADIEMSLPQNQFPNSMVYSQSTAAQGGGGDSQATVGDNGDGDDNDGDIFDQIGDTISSIFGDDEEEAEEAVTDAESAVEGVEGAVQGAEQAVEGVEGAVQGAEQAVEGVEGAVQGAEQAVEGVEGAVQGAEQAVEGVEGAVSEVEQAAEGVETAVGEISEVEGELSQVETIGAEAETAAEDIEGAENAEGTFAKMLNFCSNPIDNLTKGDNLLSGLGSLAQNPDDVINQAESLIGAGQDAVGGMANGSSSSDILGSIMGIAGQFMGGGASNGDDGTQDGSTDDGSGGGGDLLSGIMGMVGQFTGGEGNSDPSAGTTADEVAQVSVMESKSEEANPEEFANADLYGDGYN